MLEGFQFIKSIITNKKQKFIVALGITLIISLFVSFAGYGLMLSAYAEEAVSLTGSGGAVTFYESLDSVAVDSNITLTGETFDGAKVSISQGFISGSDELLFDNQNGITGSYDATSGILSLMGIASAENYQTALRSVKFRNLNGSSYNSAPQKTISFSIGQSTLYNQDNGHFYEFVVSPSISWTNAKNEAEGRSYYGLKGYLTTITSSSENAFITQKLNGFGWIGANDAENENIWKWVTGPEAGTVISNTTYTNWAPGEPNNYYGVEDWAHFYSDGSWNDFPHDSNAIAGYVVEYGGMTGDPQVTLTATSTINLDAKPTISNITDQTTNEDTSVTVPFTINDDMTPVASLLVTATSSDEGASIQLNGTGSERNMVITPVNNKSGAMTITVLVNDGHSEVQTTFELNVIDTTKTLTIHGANGTPGETDAHTEFSLDGGQTWQPAYLYGYHPWGFVPGTNSWLNCVANGQACLNMEVLYRVQFSVPDDATNAEMKFDIKADNYATISLNGTHVTEIVGQNSVDLDASIASEIQPGLNTILINVKDEGGWAGLNYKITLSINAPTAPVLVDPAPTALVTYSTTAPTKVNVVASITPSESVTVTNNNGSASYTFTENGSFTFKFVDAAGNTGEVTAVVSNIDKVAPVTTASTGTAPNSNGWFNEEVTANFAATDDYSGVAQTYYTVDGAEAQVGTSVIVSGEGNHVVTYWSVDEAGNIETVRSLSINLDITAPELTVSIVNSTLWSPNHKLVDISALIKADDGLSELESIVLTSITSNELDYDPSTVDDDVANDILGAAFGENDTSFQLRSERSGEGTGRVYTITYTVTDKAGNQTTIVAWVEVPHDQGNNKEVPKGKGKK